MPKLSPAKPHIVIKKLRKLGFDGPFGGGRHVFMRHPETHIKIPVPVHKGRDIPTGTLRAIIRQAGVSVEEWTVL
ncbi:MAG TPA: type II toxin-antitoxin system HicA family toxin [Anaerolineae bacterium]|nr:type II toxin-antitoxin system HicA family toxin [Anaerolineae bacterium]